MLVKDVDGEATEKRGSATRLGLLAEIVISTSCRANTVARHRHAHTRTMPGGVQLTFAAAVWVPHKVNLGDIAKRGEEALDVIL